MEPSFHYPHKKFFPGKIAYNLSTTGCYYGFPRRWFVRRQEVQY
jgi:hypothetical protein